MSLAFELSIDDVLNVAHIRGLKLSSTQAESLFNNLDHDAVEMAALKSTDVDEQVKFAYQEIKEQLTESLKGVVTNV
jgi:hypothetical protein